MLFVKRARLAAMAGFAPAIVPLFCLLAAGCARGIDFGDNPSRPVAKTDKALTAPPPELRDGSARETARLTPTNQTRHTP